MGFTTDENMIRIDYFKESGKWYTTEAVKWAGERSFDKEHPSLLEDDFARTLRVHLGPPNRSPAMTGKVTSPRLSGMIAVCLIPFHQFSIPIMMPVDDAYSQRYNSI